MKKLNAVLFFFAIALCALLFCPLKGYADTVTLTLVNVGGQSSGPAYVYPYYFSINGSATLTPLMCLSYENEVYFGETWTATVVPVTGTQYVEAGYIFSLAEQPGASATTIAEAQWANWELFDPNDSNLTNNLPAGYQGDINTILSNALAFAKADPNTNQFSGYSILVPVDGSQPNSDGLPQTFFGDPPGAAPEPSSYLLFGTGLLGLAAAFWYRRRSIAL